MCIFLYFFCVYGIGYGVDNEIEYLLYMDKIYNDIYF